MLPALIIFLLTYLLMLVLPQYRPFAALGGAALFLALGAAGLWDFTLMDAARAVDFNVLLMMAGTMARSPSSLRAGCPPGWPSCSSCGCPM